MCRRYQLSRQKGYRKPEGVIVVSRPGKYGNPFETAEEFRTALKDGSDCNLEQGLRMLWISQNLHQLQNKSLACWCPLDRYCHADVIMEHANPHLRWNSFALWEPSVCTDEISSDSHDSWEAAQGVIKLLNRSGYGGNRKHFPLATWVQLGNEITDTTRKYLRVGHGARWTLERKN